MNRASQINTHLLTLQWIRKKYVLNALLFLFSVSIISTSQGAENSLYISEFLTKGNSTYADEDGEYPDWIEIFNAGNTPINLNGWHLTDDPILLTKWTFPEITLSSGKYLTVFASGKDRAGDAAPLHTNFRLEENGEYLALVRPDGQTIAHEYNPYPSQEIPKDGYSFGLRTEERIFVSSGSSLHLLVPENSAVDGDWTSPSYDDSDWQSGQMALGYGTALGKFSVTLYESNTTINNLATADRILSNRTMQRRVYTELTDVINYFDNDEDGQFTDSSPFPGHTFGVDVDDFVVLATGAIVIPSSGTWTFGINSDDGARLRIDGKDVIVDDATHGTQDTLAAIDLSAGQHMIELVYFERGGGAELELFATRGQYSTFNSRQFRLVGDRSSAGVGLEGFGSLIDWDVSEMMQNKNSSVYLRVPFEIGNPSLNYTVLMRIKYNDGFIAYINGREIARRNAPSGAAWNSNASQQRTQTESLTTEEIVVQDTIDLLKPGTNVLAIHGMNYSNADEDFLIQAELSGISVLANDRRYLNPPTPGTQNVSGVLGFVDEVKFSQKHGFYDDPFELILTANTEDASITYTTDGTEPSETNGTNYTNPIQIDRTTILRAAVVKPGYLRGDITTQTYLFLDDVITQTPPAGYPTRWGGGNAADYEMDPDVVNSSRYRDTIEDDLKSLPVMSFVTDPNNLFDSRTGIYTHPESKGAAWERPCSTEFFYPTGDREGFQINSGLRIQGGYGRTPDKRKHSFRILFKRDYGPPTLRYKMFDNSPVDKFDQLVLRSGYNYTWHGGEGGFDSSIARADYMRDEFSRRMELAAGKVASHGRFIHLYLNGLYWGVYTLCERPDDGFGAEYFGGEKEEYDVVTSGTKGINTTQVKAGNKDAWNAMMDLVRAGGFEDPQKYEAIQEYVDIDNLINYMLVIYFAGNRDAPTVIGGGGTPWNFYSNHRRVPGEGFRFFCWDSEWTLEEPTRNVITHHTQGYDDPSFIFLKLKSNPDFLMRVSDRIQKLFFNGGGLSPESSLAVYSDLTQQMDRAIVGESARWGDVRGGRAKTRDDDWRPEVERILATYLPVRSEIVVEQLRDSGFYPIVPAPSFSQHGGTVDYGYQLSMELQDDIQQDMLTTSLIAIDDVWKFNQADADPGRNWTSPAYNDANWPSNKALFYVESSQLSAPKNTALDLGRTTYYFRKKFELPSTLDPSETTIQLSPFVDDGLVAYINGEEIFRIGMPDGTVDRDTYANRTTTNAAFEGPFEIPIESLKAGQNTIAVEVHQTNASSSDVVFGLTLDALTPLPDDSPQDVPIYYTLDGSDPRLTGGELNPKAKQIQGAISLNNNVTVKARTLFNDRWSALNEASFLIESAPASVATVQENLRVSELMYNPADGEEFEFVELHNTHPTSELSIDGLGFTNGIDFVIPNGTKIPADGYLLVVPATNAADRTAFLTHYGLANTVPTIGPYSGKLSNSGERITLSALQTGSEIISFAYNDGRGWPQAADGAGHSLVPQTTAFGAQNVGSLEYGGNWRASYAIGGSPGKADPEPPASVVVNELLANAKTGESDWIELFNTANGTIHLGDWYLSDDSDDLAKWPIPAAELEAGRWIGFDEQNDFDNPVGSGFGLSRDGETLFLSYLPGVSGVDRVVDAVSFKAQDSDRAWGRYSDGYPYFVDTELTTRGASNEPASPTLVIDELMVQPLADSVDDVSFEYIELFNASDKPRALQNSDGAYRLDGGVQYEFPLDAEIPADGRLLVVGFDPSNALDRSAFLSNYGMSDSNVSILGPYSGKLSNSGERIALEKPKSVDELTRDKTWGIVDEVIYFTSSPWTNEANGTGSALQRIDAGKPGSDPSNWRAAEPTPDGQPTAVRSWMVY